MATPGGGKKGKKKKGGKGQTLSLNAFLGDSPTVAKPAVSSSSWADDDDLGPADLAEEYGGPPKPSVDLSKLPSAPRASRGVDIDLSKLPPHPPYTAFLGNLPFETDEEDIVNLFRGLKVENIRFPQDQGRSKGFGYAEFYDIEQLKKALALNGEKVRQRPIRIDIADGSTNQRGDSGGFQRGGYGGGQDDRTDNDWRRDEGPPAPRSDDRRGGGGGFDRRGPHDDVDGRPPRQPAAADLDDQWRRSGPSEPSTNGWGARRDDRGPRGGFDDRGSRGGFDDRGPRGGFDDRGPRGGFDDRGPRGGFRDDRGPRGGFDDHGPRGGFDDRGPRGGFDDRGPRGGFDDRGPRGGFRDDRGPRGGFDDRGPPRDRFDDRGSRGGYDDRGPRGGFRDDRGPPRGGNDGESAWRREGPTARNAPDIVPADQPKERPKLNLAPRKADTEDKSKTPTSSIFGGARPVDTAVKERQIEERLEKSPNRDTRRDRSQDDNERRGGDRRGPRDGPRDGPREGPRDGPRDGPPPRDNPDNTAMNWRDENLRKDDRPPKQGGRPDVVPESDRLGRANKDGGRGRGRGRSNERERPKKNRDKDGNIIVKKYEEPEKVSFGKTSKFALLAGDDDAEDDDDGSGDEANDVAQT